MRNQIKRLIKEQANQEKIMNVLFKPGQTLPFDFKPPNGIYDDDDAPASVHIKGAYHIREVGPNSLSLTYTGTYDEWGDGEEEMLDEGDGYGMYYMGAVVEHLVLNKLMKFGIKECNIKVFMSPTQYFLFPFREDLASLVNSSRYEIGDDGEKFLYEEEGDGKYLPAIERHFLNKKINFDNGITGQVTKAELWGKRIHLKLVIDSPRPTHVLAAANKLSRKIRSYFNVNVSVSAEGNSDL